MSNNTCTDCATLGALPACNQPECPTEEHLTAAKHTKTFTDANGEGTDCQVCGYTCDGQAEPCDQGQSTLYTLSYQKWNGTDLELATCYGCSHPPDCSDFFGNLRPIDSFNGNPACAIIVNPTPSLSCYQVDDLCTSACFGGPINTWWSFNNGLDVPPLNCGEGSTLTEVYSSFIENAGCYGCRPLDWDGF